jgi:AraC-like DNA-binding protein
VVGARLQEALIAGCWAPRITRIVTAGAPEPGNGGSGRDPACRRGHAGVPGKPFTVADLAAIAGVSIRCLQESFRRYVGTPPMT